MALFEQRVFRSKEQWWIAQIVSSGGAGSPEEGPTIERVTFTCTSEPDSMSRSRHITPSMLNKMSHASLVNVLENAQPVDFRMDFSPTSLPTIDYVSDENLVIDAEQLRWVLREIVQPQLQSNSEITTSRAIDVICLDDSALRGQVGITASLTLAEVLSLQAAAARAIVETVKGQFRNYSLEELDPG